MGIYAIGDVQGCRDAFDRLLKSIRFDKRADSLYLVGDLVNRGPDSAGVLRRVMALGECAVAVLGNHDLNTLAVAEGVRAPRPQDTVSGLLAASDAEALLDWLRRRPLLVERDGMILCHAGIYPSWTLDFARARAREVEAALRDERYTELLRRMYGDEPRRWRDDLKGWERLRFIINAFTRMRFVSADGALDFEHAGPPGTQGAGLAPWFEFESRAPLPGTPVCGHWAALGVHHGDGVVALDTGCVWGNALTAVELSLASGHAAPVAFHSVHCSGDS